MSKIRLKRKNLPRKIRDQGVVLVLILATFAGCNGNHEAICREFPTVADEIQGLQTQIALLDVRPEPKRPGRAARKLASVAAVPLPSADEILERRDSWMEWGEKALKRTQWAKDALEDDKRGRKAVPALNEAGLALVSFHGFLEQKKWRKANAELEKAESSLTRARKIACDAEVPTRAPAGSKHKSDKKRRK